MVFDRLDTVLLRVADILASKTWYEQKLEFTELYFDPDQRLVVFDSGGGTSLTLWQLNEGQQVTRSDIAVVFPIFSVKNARIAKDILQGRGVDVGDLVDDGGVTYFTFKDPDGNQLEACQVH